MNLEDELRQDGDFEAEIQRATRSLRKENDRLKEEVEKLRSLAGLLDQVHDFKPHPPKWAVARRRGEHHAGTVTLQFSDAHFGEVVIPDQIEFANAYNDAVALKRLQRMTENTIEMSRDYVTGLNLEGIVILATGDLFTGNIHEELRRTNAMTLFESFAYWIDPVEAMLNAFAKEFGNVHLAGVVGNHGREPGKPIYKNRAQENIEWLLWSMVARDYRNRDDVTISVSAGMDYAVPIYETNYLITHGDEFRGGSGISGSRAPLALGQHRTSVRQMALGKPMDYLVVGHFHTYRPPGDGIIQGGSLKGYDEFAYGKRFRPEAAQQGMWITTPEHGPTMSMPIIVQKRDEEGW